MELDGGETVWSDRAFLSDQRSRLGRAQVSVASVAASYPSMEMVGLTPELLTARTVRRTSEIFIAVVGLILMAPLLLAILLAIKFESKGPVLFRQARVGRDGTIFTMVKFRTMLTNAEQRLHELEIHNESVGGVLFKMRADPRVTRVGRVLRRCNLDEIPQLLNVFWGDMSLVGPRPLPLRDSQLLSMHHPSQYQARLGVRPGITGEWQTRRGGDSDYRHMLDLDMEYLRRRSLRHDAVIAVKTVWILLRSVVRR